MKKRIALFLAALFAFSMVATAAFASGVDTHAECQHASGTTVYEYDEYEPYDNDNHYYCRVRSVICNCCLEEVQWGLLAGRFEKHSHSDTGHYIRSSHSGKYTTHYYVYSGVCENCFDEITWENHDVGCTEYNCVDPMCS